VADLVTLARFSSRPECIVAQSLLRSEGIETLMPDFNVLTADFDPSMMESGWRLLVREQDLARAQAILREAQQAGGAN
jgi:putative signal transducing protein